MSDIINSSALNKLKEAINKKVVSAFEGDISNILKETESKAIELKVLDSYSPKQNVRRTGDDGFESVSNMNSTVSIKGDTVTLSVSNDTPTVIDRDYRLDQAIIEGGDFYEYPVGERNSNQFTYLNGRDYVTETIEELKKNGKIEEVLKKQLGDK